VDALSDQIANNVNFDAIAAEWRLPVDLALDLPPACAEVLCGCVCICVCVCVY